MRIRLVGQSLLEWVGLRLGFVPIPVLHVLGMPIVAAAIGEATALGIFDFLAEHNKLTLGSLASYAGAEEGALGKLLAILEATGYVKRRNTEHWELSRLARKFMVSTSGKSVKAHILFTHQISTKWLYGAAGLGHYLRTGEGQDLHVRLKEAEWGAYQAGMESLGAVVAPIVARHLNTGPNARRMLDIGGSHGLFSASCCALNPLLTATVLDLERALEGKGVGYNSNLSNAGLVKGMERVNFVAGDALAIDLILTCEGPFDFILISNLIHHLEDKEVEVLLAKAAASLAPRGVVVIQEFVAPVEGSKPETVGAVTSLFFGMTSGGGNRTALEYSKMLGRAGLRCVGKKALLGWPGHYQFRGEKD
jgi:hypothetical protein